MVEAVGEGVTGWSPGDRLIAMLGHGGLAEKLLVPAAAAVPLPPQYSFVQGSALVLTYATTIHALLDRGKLKAGETLLILGAAGGVGLAAVELGKAFGAHVVAAVSSEEKAEAVRAAGADEVVIYPRGPFDKEGAKALAASFKQAVGPGGANLIYDPVGGDYTEAALRAIAWEGRCWSSASRRNRPTAAQPRAAEELRHMRSLLGRFMARTRRPCRPSGNAVSAMGRRQDRTQGQSNLAARAGGGRDFAHGGAGRGGKARRHHRLNLPARVARVPKRRQPLHRPVTPPISGDSNKGLP